MSGESSGTHQTDEEYAWVQTAHLFCDRLGIERRADAHHICVGISDCKSSLRAVEAERNGYIKIVVDIASSIALPDTIRYFRELRDRLEAAEAREKQALATIASLFYSQYAAVERAALASKEGGG